MLHPKYWLRQRRLRRALLNYPLYDPPHKGEERILPVEKALENFRYFIEGRKKRVEFFIKWLFYEFDVVANLEKDGIENTFDWIDTYVPVIMPDNIQGAEVYYCYSQPWVADYAGASAFMDLGAMLGEAIIGRCPHLRWQMEWSLSDYPDIAQTLQPEKKALLRCREREIRQLKKEKRSGYRRPILTSATDPIPYEPVYSMLDSYFMVINQYITMKAYVRDATVPEGLKSRSRSYLRNWFNSVQDRYR